MFQAFSIGPFLVWLKVVFLLLGIVLSVEFFLRLSRSARLSLKHFREYSWLFLGVFFLGGRLLSIIAQYRVYALDPLRIFIIWDGGFSFLGGVIGIALALYWVTREHHTTFLQWLDVLLPATAFGFAFDWLGAFAAGNSYGKPTDVFWGVTYDVIHVRYVVPVHPVQLYYAIFFFALTFILLLIRKKAKRAGAETLFGIVLSCMATFLFEYFRGDFGIPVFATQLDFVVLVLLFMSLGLFAAVELRLSEREVHLYEGLLISLFGGYLFLRWWLKLPTFELRFTQFLAVLALLGTVVYVIVHRRKYPHL